MFFMGDCKATLSDGSQIAMTKLDFTPASAEQTPETIRQCRQALAATARQAHQRRLAAGNLGAISMRLPKAGLFLITPFETSFAELRNEETCLVDATGTLQEMTSGWKLPPETPFHLKSYAVRTDIHAIAHLHPPHASAYAQQGKVFNLVTDTARHKIKEILCVQCRECISRFCGLCSCRTDIRTSYAGVNVLILKEDGIVTLGASLEDALNLADLAERTSRQDCTADTPSAFR